MSNDKNQHKEAKSSGSDKRKTVKKLLVGGGVATGLNANWGKPLVDSIVLPAHALMTEEIGQGAPSFSPLPTPTVSPFPTPTLGPPTPGP